MFVPIPRSEPYLADHCRSGSISATSEPSFAPRGGDFAATLRIAGASHGIWLRGWEDLFYATYEIDRRPRPNCVQPTALRWTERSGTIPHVRMWSDSQRRAARARRKPSVIRGQKACLSRDKRSGVLFNSPRGHRTKPASFLGGYVPFPWGAHKVLPGSVFPRRHEAARPRLGEVYEKCTRRCRSMILVVVHRVA